MALLPKTRDDFNKASFWDNFNAKTAEFEWYGSFSQLSVVKRYITPTSRVLVIGCGNSSFSAELFDSGVEDVTNIDFDEKVINDMTTRNKSRASMKWQVMDMKKLDFDESSFDVVFDKGALDALMSSPESKQDAIEMIDSISRVLKPTGCYTCVSLAQEFIFSHLAESVAKHFDSMNIHLLKEAAGNSSHVPFLLVLKRQQIVSSNQQSVSTDANNGEVSKTKSKSKGKKLGYCFFKESLDVVESKSSLNGVSMDRCWANIKSAQDSFKMVKMRSDLKQLKPGRLESIELWVGSKPASGGGGGAKEDSQNMKSKYTLTILDMNGGSSSGEVSVSAFIVPQGREHEYLFSSEDGLKQIAQSASCSRLLSFALNRGHVFNDLEQVKAELNQTVIDFSPQGFKGMIPFITTQEGAGVRNAIAEGKLASGDDYIVEEAEIEGRVVRRLVFMTNSNVIQTEVRLINTEKASTFNITSAGGDDDDWGLSSTSSGTQKNSSKSKKSGKKNKKPSKKKTEVKCASSSSPDVDNSFSTTVATSVNEQDISGCVDYTYMCFDYHRAIIAGVLYLSDSLLTPNKAGASNPSGIVVGLGGGALPMMLHHFFPQMSLQVAELDKQVVSIASQWFGFKEDDAYMKVVLGDGLYIDLGLNKQAFVVLDVDSKDSSVGMSCPPVSFLSETYLNKVKASLVKGGLLVVNVAARSNEMYNSALKSIEKVFHGGRMFISKASDDDANTVVFAVNEDGLVQTSEANKAAQHMAMAMTVKDWLVKIPGQEDDPLGLFELAEDIKNINA